MHVTKKCMWPRSCDHNHVIKPKRLCLFTYCHYTWPKPNYLFPTVSCWVVDQHKGYYNLGQKLTLDDPYLNWILALVSFLYTGSHRMSPEGTYTKWQNTTGDKKASDIPGLPSFCCAQLLLAIDSRDPSTCRKLWPHDSSRLLANPMACQSHCR